MPKFPANNQQLLGIKPPLDKPYEDYRIQGVPGLSMRVSKTGSKTWRVEYRISGNRRFQTLGQFGSSPGKISLVEAKDQCAEIRAGARSGIDPRLQLLIDLKFNQQSSDRTVGVLFGQRIENLRKYGRSEKYIRNTENSFALNILPTLSDIPIELVSKANIEVPLNRLASEGKYTSHNDLLRIWRAFVHDFEVEDASRRIKFIKPLVQQRLLTANEIMRVLNVSGGAADPHRNIASIAVDLAVCTLVRSGACALAKVVDFDLKRNTWMVPAADEKTSLPYAAPLNGRAQIVVRAAMERRTIMGVPVEQPYLFPHRDDASAEIRQDSLLQNWQRCKKKAGLSHNRAALHNVRHSAVTLLAAEGVETNIADKLLQHRYGASEKKVAMIYQGYDFMSERRDALETWGMILENSTP